MADAEFILAELVAALAALPSNIIAHVEPPREFRIFRAGRNETRKGVFTFDAEAAKSVQSRSEVWGVEHAIDYNHAMIANAAATPAPDEAGKAAGWFRLALRDGELWAVDVRWTPAAARAISAGEWRYISPYFSHTKEGRVIELLNVAITNLPATNKLDPLVALSVVSDTGCVHTEDNRRMDKALLTALGLAETASDADVAVRIAALVQSEAASKANVAKLSADVARLEGELATERTSKLSEEIEAAVKAGKLMPALREWAINTAKTAPETIRAYLNTAAPVVQIENQGERKPAENPSNKSTVALTADDKHVLSLLSVSGLDENKFAENRAKYDAERRGN
jgi:phage I-like protein